MKITIYELLGLVKDGKAPKKIKYRDRIWEYTSTVRGTGYQYYSIYFEEWKTLQDQVYLEERLNDEVEIIKEPKKIKKLPKEITDNVCATRDQKIIANKIDELIDEINNLKEK